MPIASSTSATDPQAVHSGDAAGGSLTGSYPNPSIANLAVQTAHLNALAVTAAKLAAGVGVLTQLFDSTLGGAAATIDTGANGVGQGSQHLLILLLVRTAEVAGISSCGVRFNNDSGSNYDNQNLQAAGGTVSSGGNQAQSSAAFGAAGASETASQYAPWALFIPAYTQTTANKHFTGLGGLADQAAAGQFVQIRTGNWRSTAAITRVAVICIAGSNLSAGSRMSIFGLG